MRKTLLTSICFLAFFLSNSQSQTSYILTTDGEKIDIALNEEITCDIHSGLEYCKTVKIKRILDDTLKTKKTKTIKIKKIEKIVDGNWLYLPFKNKKGKLRIFRQIAKNKNYILGHSKLKFDSNSAVSGKWRTTSREYFVILDHNYNLIKEGLIRDKDGEIVTESIDEIQKEFGSCLNRDGLFDNVTIKYLDPKPFTKVKVQKIEVPHFLYKTNQLNCM